MKFVENHFLYSDASIRSSRYAPSAEGKVTPPLSSTSTRFPMRKLSGTPSAARRTRKIAYLATNCVRHQKSFDGLIPAVSTPPIARVGAFFIIFRYLQDWHSFTSLTTQNSSKSHLSFDHITKAAIRRVAVTPPGRLLKAAGWCHCLCDGVADLQS